MPFEHLSMYSEQKKKIDLRSMGIGLANDAIIYTLSYYQRSSILFR